MAKFNVNSFDISEITRPKSAGKIVDTHVVLAPREPEPDYNQMRRVVYGESMRLDPLRPRRSEERDLDEKE